MSKLLDETANISVWSPQEVRDLTSAGNRPGVPDPEAVFELTGFLSGQEACEIRLSPQEVIARAKKRADEIAREAYNKGFEQGERAGFELGNKKAEAVAEALLATLEEIRQCRVEVLRQGETEAVRLAMVLAEKIVCREISLHEDVVIDVAREALSLCAESDRIRIEVNPEDDAFLKGCGDRFQKEVQGMKGIETVANPAVQRGGCIVDTALGRIDARVEKKIEILFGKLKEKIDASISDSDQQESS